jgi:hypothetical protein
MDRIENDPSNNSSIVACVRYRGGLLAEPLPSNDMGGIHIQTQTDVRDLGSRPLRWAQVS